MSRIDYDLTQIKAFAFDVDGVLSPSTIPLDATTGISNRMVNIKDGYAIQLARKLGYPIAIITGANVETINVRYKSLGVEDIYIGAKIKIDIFTQWLKDRGLEPEKVMYMGDDIPDYECLNLAGLSCCPRDAAVDISSIVKYISPIDGGYGCARDVIEQVLRAQGQWMYDEKAFGW